MKKQLLTFTFALITLFSIAQTATNFTVNDCTGASHDLYAELNSGKVIALVWVMPCGACIGPALTTSNIVQSYGSSNPGRVLFYLVDDVANTNCTSLSSWASSNNIAHAVRFSNSTINMADYGSQGMPKVVVLGGSSHTIFYNANNTVDATAMQNAINSALVATGINESNGTVTSFNIYPNPAGNKTEIVFNLNKSSVVHLQLYDLQGKLLQNVFSGKGIAGENRFDLNVSNYNAGMYLVKLTEGDKSRFTNMVIAH